MWEVSRIIMQGLGVTVGGTRRLVVRRLKSQTDHGHQLSLLADDDRLRPLLSKQREDMKSYGNTLSSHVLKLDNRQPVARRT